MRGAQGQALKTLIGIAYLKGDPMVIEAQGIRHEIAPTVTPIVLLTLDTQQAIATGLLAHWLRFMLATSILKASCLYKTL